jgi:MFS family permease
MNAAAIQAGPPASASGAGAVNPWVIAMLVALASFMEVLDTTIANVALPYIAGGMGVSEDEASWVVTTYLVANAIILTASSFLARMLGRKTFFLICLGLFTLSSILCGFAPNLNALLLFRILQGLGGGGMVPVAQSILADAFPPNKRGQAFAVFGVAVVVAPVVGPTLGGWLSDNISWHWCFLINAPVGLIAMALIALVLQESPTARAEVQAQQQGIRFDVVGFMLVATFLGALEMVLDRGLEDDWFGSSFIVTFTVISGLAFVLMIPWGLTRKNPIIDLRMVASRQFGACFLVMLATGAILLATTQFLPLLVQQDFGYTATWAGLARRRGHHGHDVRRRPPGGQGAAQISDHRRRNSHRALDVQHDQRVRRSRLLVHGAVAHAARRRPAVDLRSDHGRILRRHPALQDRPGLSPDQRCPQHRRIDRRLHRFQRADASPAVSPEPVDRAGGPVKPAISRYAAAGHEFLHRPWQLTGPGA